MSEEDDGSENFPMPIDTRPEDCPKIKTDLSGLTVSIIIPWLAESWEHMRGTLLALLHFTPAEFIEEIIFISDGNEDTREDRLVKISSKVKVLALPQREGLIRAKMKGVAMAKAPVLVFMEAHCIVNRQWLEPLLERVVIDEKALAMPALDVIPPENFGVYRKSVHGYHWRYEWNLNLIQTNPLGYRKETWEPYTSPGTSGGIFAMRKDWFQQLHLFDTGMLEWGGDHVELTMKVWRCGGRIEIVPCSRIGHVFREPKNRPYDVSVNQVVSNYARLAQVWLKDHLKHFYDMKPEARYLKFDDLPELRRKHDELQCHNMTWYLENVDHEMNWELPRLCHPYVADNNPLKCKGSLPPGRWTNIEGDLMPRDEYIKAVARAEARKKTGIIHEEF